jgi:hypothetical protein
MLTTQISVSTGDSRCSRSTCVIPFVNGCSTTVQRWSWSSVRREPLAWVFATLVIALLSAACTSTDLQTSTEPSLLKCQVTLSNPSSAVEASGGVSTTQVSAAPECAWSASADVNWIANPSPASGQGSAELQFTVMPNDNAAERQGTLSVNDTKLRVNQAPAPCRFEVTPRTVSIGRGGGSSNVTVTTASGCGWTASPDGSWISVTPSSGTGTATFNVAAPSNPGLVRIGSVSVAGLAIVVSQEASTPSNCTASLQPSSATVPAAGGQAPPIAATVPAGCSWTAQSTVPWLTITDGASGNGPGTVSYSAAANSGVQRSGVLSIAGQAFSVTQAAVPCSFSVTPTTLSASSTGGPLPSVTVTAANGCTWTSTSQAGWLTFGSSPSGSGTGSVQVVASSNGTTARSGAVTIAGTTVNVTQPALTCTFGITPSSQSIASAGGAGTTIAVTAPSPCGWTATTSDNWITITSGASGTGNGSVGFTIAANSGGARTGTLSIAGQTFTVNQAAAPPAPCTYSINPSSQSIAAAGGAGTNVGVTAGNGCAWTAATSDTWITITSGASGNGNGTVGFTIAANSGGARTGTLAIAGQTFTVNQAAAPPAPCTYSINPSSQSIAAAGGAGTSIGVTAGNGCAWTAATSDTWITITSGASGNGNGTVGFTIAANSGIARTGRLTVAGQTFTVNQAAAPPAPCTYQINPASQAFGASGGPGTNVAVTTAGGCAWSATNNGNSWINISSASGNGNGSVMFSVAANTGPARTGSMTIAGQNFDVSQASGCAYQITPTSQSIGAAGGAGTNIAVTTTAGCTWTASPNDPWLTITSGAPPAGNGTVTFTIAANTGGARTGSLTVAGRPFSVSQASGCVVQIAPSSQTVPKGASSHSFNVTAAANCAWTAVANDSWLTITSPSSGSGSGNGTVTYSVPANPLPGHQERTGTISVLTNTFTVTQQN